MPGPSCTFATCQALALASQNHETWCEGSGSSWDNFNVLLCEALNLAEQGEITHWAMLHADVNPEDGWLDVLVDEAERTQSSFASVVCPLKNSTGVTSSGIGDPTDNWRPWRRFTMSEVQALPETFTAADAGYPGWPLLHNNGCCLFDLRDRRFFTVDAENVLKPAWIFPKRVIRNAEGRFVLQGESEDWYMSRMLWEMGVPSALTRKIRLEHIGLSRFPNDSAWGQSHDEAAAFKWRKIPGTVFSS